MTMSVLSCLVHDDECLSSFVHDDECLSCFVHADECLSCFVHDDECLSCITAAACMSKSCFQYYKSTEIHANPIICQGLLHSVTCTLAGDTETEVVHSLELVNTYWQKLFLISCKPP